VGKIAKPGEKPTPDQKKAMDDMERVECRSTTPPSISCKASLTVFNEQVKVYKSKNDKSKG